MSETTQHFTIVAFGMLLYTILTALGLDGSPLLAAAIGWAGGSAARSAQHSNGGSL